MSTPIPEAVPDEDHGFFTPEVFPTLPEHGPQTGTVEMQLIVIMDGKVMVQDTQTIPRGCYTLETTVTPKDCCK